MRFTCATCGAVFDDIQQLANHKRLHQSSRDDAPKGVTCLSCARKIPIDPSQANYKGPLTCPTCHRTMSVILRDGEVVIARLG